jgi:hypothetical protein
VWLDPDLEEMRRVRVRWIVFTVADSLARAHHLNFSWAQHLFVSKAILMLKLPLQHKRQDLHVTMSMHAETLSSGNPVVVDYPQGPETHLARIIVVTERERVSTLEPAYIR